MFDSFRTCSECNSNKLQRSFGINGRGEPYKTCENCRLKYRVNTAKYSSIINNSIDTNEYNNNFNNNNNDSLNYKQELII